MENPKHYLITRSGRRLIRYSLSTPKPFVFPFLQLPAEIRIMIYEMALVFGYFSFEEDPHKKRPGPHRISISSETLYPRFNQASVSFKEQAKFYSVWSETEWKQITISLLSVNRQIRLEALPIFFGKNMFHIDGGQGAIAFLSDQPTLALKSLRSAHVSIYLGSSFMNGPDLEIQLSYMAERLQLKELEIQLWLLLLSEFLPPPCDYDNFIENHTRMPWMSSLMKIQNLQKLSVILGPSEDPKEFIADHWTKLNEFSKRLEKYLKPKMCGSPGPGTMPRGAVAAGATGLEGEP